MEVKIVKSLDGVYDIFDAESQKWIFSQVSEYNVFAELAERKMTVRNFVDKEFNISFGN